MVLRLVRSQPLLAALLVAASAAVFVSAVEIIKAGAQPRQLDVPYVPTPQHIVDSMLRLAAPTDKDFLVDLGSGDGRIPVTAALRYGTRGFGVDLNPERVKEARANAEKAKVADKVQFIEGDLFKTDFTKATVLTMYLLPRVNMRLRPQVLDMRPGTRVVSHDFDMEDWKPDQVEKHEYKVVYFWVVPAKVAGAWTLAAGERKIALQLQQQFQEVSGTATVDGQSGPIANARIRGETISFEIALPGGSRQRFEGRVVAGDRIEGQGWQATKG